MGKTELVFIALLTVAAIGLFSLKSKTEPHENTLFEIWKQKMHKQYDPTQNQYRYQVWFKNFAYVKSHNARYEAELETFDLEMNLFADLTN